MFDCTFVNIVSVSPKNAVRVPSSPDIMPGIRSFRTTIVSPNPNALKIPITFLVTEEILSTQDLGSLIGSVPSPRAKETLRMGLAHAGRLKPAISSTGNELSFLVAY